MRDRAQLAERGGAQDRRGRDAIAGARRDVIGAAIRAVTSTKWTCSEDVEALAKLDDQSRVPARLLEREAGVGEIIAQRVDAHSRERDPQVVAREIDSVERYVLIDVIHADRATDSLGLSPNERESDFERVEQGARADLRAGHVGPRPGVSEQVPDGQALRSEPEILAQLKRLLLMEVGSAVEGEGGPVAETR